MIKNIVSISITLVVFIVAVWLLITNPNLLNNLKNVSVLSLIWVFVFILVNIFLNVLINKLIFSPVANVKWSDCAYSTVISTLANYFIPLKLGSAYQAIFLKRKYNLPLSWFTGTFGVTFLLTILISCVFGLVVIIDLFLVNKIFSWLLLGLFLGVLCFTSLLLFFDKFILFFMRKFEFKSSFLTRLKLIIKRIADGMAMLRNNKKVFWGLLVLTFLYVVNSILITYFEFRIVSSLIDFKSVILFSSLSLISIFINITPGALGVREFIQFVFSKFIQVSGAQIVAISIIDRGVLLFVLLLLSFIFFNINLIKKKHS